MSGAAVEGGQDAGPTLRLGVTIGRSRPGDSTKDLKAFWPAKRTLDDRAATHALGGDGGRRRSMRTRSPVGLDRLIAPRPPSLPERRADFRTSSGVAGGCHAGADAQEQLATHGLDPARGLQVGLGGGRGVEQVEAEAGLEVPLGAGHRSQPDVGRHDVAGQILGPDSAVAVAVLGGEQAGPVEVEERRQGGVGEAIDVVGEAPRDMVVAEPLAHHVGVLALDQGVVVRAPGAGLGEALDAQLVEQPGDAVVDVLAAVVGVEAEDAEREGPQQALEQRQQEALGDADRGADELVLGDLVDQG